MSNEFVSLCKLKTFGLSENEFHDTMNTADTAGAAVTFEEKKLSGVITIAKNDVDSVAIANALRVVKRLFDKFIYSDSDEDINGLLVRRLIDEGNMLSVAESITGGLIASRICEINGASQVLYEGLVTYNSAAKVRRLHVPAGIIELETAVSEPVCRHMLEGVLTNKEITYAIATTGYASDMSEMNGLAYVGYGSRERNYVDQVKFNGSRNEIREQVANYGLFKLLKLISDGNNRF